VEYKIDPFQGGAGVIFPTQPKTKSGASHQKHRFLNLRPQRQNQIIFNKI